MKVGHVSSAASIASLLTIAFLSLASTATANAQELPRTSGGTGSETRTRVMIERNQEMREWRLRNLEKMMGAKPDPSEERARAVQQRQLLEQVGKDYRVIQELNNLVMRDARDGNFDYEFVAKNVGEINRRATRLKQHLALPKLNESEETPLLNLPMSGLSLKDSLVLLDRRIVSFVSNSFFKNPGTLDTESSFKASRDLRDIIELSRNIKRNAEQTPQP